VGDGAAERDVIQVVSRAFDVLRCFGSQEVCLGNHEIATRCALPRSTVTRLTHTLTRMGQLVYLPEEQKYRIGPSAVAMSSSMMKGARFGTLIRDRLEEVARHLAGIVGFAIPDRFHLVNFECASSGSGIDIPEVAGGRVPMAVTAGGAAYTAALEPEAGKAFIAEMEREAPDDARLLKPRLEANRQFLRRNGYVVVCGLLSPGVSGVAVPLWAPQFQTFVVVSVKLLTAMYGETRLHAEVAPRMVELGRAVAVVLQGPECAAGIAALESGTAGIGG